MSPNMQHTDDDVINEHDTSAAFRHITDISEASKTWKKSDH